MGLAAALLVWRLALGVSDNEAMAATLDNGQGGTLAEGWTKSDETLTEAVALRASGNSERAAAEWSSVETLLLTGTMLAEQGEVSEAIATLERATQLSPQHAACWRQLGLVTGDYNGAHNASLAALQRALDLDPSDLGARHGLERAEAQIEREQEVVVVAFGTDVADCGLQRLLASAKSFGVQVEVLGLGLVPWSNGLKLGLLRNFAAATTPNRIVLALDGYDMVIAENAERIATKLYDGLGPGEVLVSADQTFYFRGPDEQCYGEVYPRRGPYRFLNSGSLAGRAVDLVALLDAVLQAPFNAGWDGVSDQTLLHRFYVEQQWLAEMHRPSPCAVSQLIDTNTPTIVLDTSQRLFGNTGGRAFLGDFDILHGRLHNKRTDTFPIVLHCPGQARFRAEFERLKACGWRIDFPSCSKNVQSAALLGVGKT